MGWAHHTNCPVDLNQEPLLGPLSLLMRICKPEGTSRSPALRDTRLTHGWGPGILSSLLVDTSFLLAPLLPES